MDAEVKRALLAMATLCAKAEYCTSEIEAKLRRRQLAPSQVAEVTRLLRADRYIDDERYARAFTRDKALFARWGRRKIAFALASKGIPADMARRAWEEETDPEEYLSIARQAWLAKARGIDGADPAGRQRLWRHMASRGYDTDTIRAVEAMGPPDGD